jgi:hypothetical protein
MHTRSGKVFKAGDKPDNNAGTTSQHSPKAANPHTRRRAAARARNLSGALTQPTPLSLQDGDQDHSKEETFVAGPGPDNSVPITSRQEPKAPNPNSRRRGAPAARALRKLSELATHPASLPLQDGDQDHSKGELTSLKPAQPKAAANSKALRELAHIDDQHVGQVETSNSSAGRPAKRTRTDSGPASEPQHKKAKAGTSYWTQIKTHDVIDLTGDADANLVQERSAKSAKPKEPKPQKAGSHPRNPGSAAVMFTLAEAKLAIERVQLGESCGVVPPYTLQTGQYIPYPVTQSYHLGGMGRYVDAPAEAATPDVPANAYVFDWGAYKGLSVNDVPRFYLQTLSVSPRLEQLLRDHAGLQEALKDLGLEFQNTQEPEVASQQVDHPTGASTQQYQAQQYQTQQYQTQQFQTPQYYTQHQAERYQAAQYQAQQYQAQQYQAQQYKAQQYKAQQYQTQQYQVQQYQNPVPVPATSAKLATNDAGGKPSPYVFDWGKFSGKSILEVHKYYLTSLLAHPKLDLMCKSHKGLGEALKQVKAADALASRGSLPSQTHALPLRPQAQHHQARLATGPLHGASGVRSNFPQVSVPVSTYYGAGHASINRAHDQR